MNLIIPKPLYQHISAATVGVTTGIVARFRVP